MQEVKKVAASYQVTITEYLNAVLLYALMQKQEKDAPYRYRPVKIAMPVNLRQFFPSKTLRNFITMVYPSIDPRLGEYTFEEIVEQVHNYMRYYINKKFLRIFATKSTKPKLLFTGKIIKLRTLRNDDIIISHLSSSFLTSRG